MPSTPERPTIQQIINDHARRIRTLERYREPMKLPFIFPEQCMRWLGEGTEDDPFIVGPKIDPVDGNQLGCTEDGLFVGATPGQFDAVVDGTIAESDPVMRLFQGIGEACAYLDSIGLESVNILVRNDQTGFGSSGNVSYVEAANWASPSSVHLFGLRGGPGGNQFQTGIKWEIASFRPLSSTFSPPNYYIHNFAQFDITDCATQKFGVLELINTGIAQWSGTWAAQLATWLMTERSTIRAIQSKTFATMTWMDTTDLIVGGLSGGSATFVPGSTYFSFEQGDLINESSSGTISMTLPTQFDISCIQSLNANRQGTVAGQVLNVAIPSGGNGRLKCFPNGFMNLTSASTTGYLDIDGGFNTVNFSGGCARLRMNVTCSGDLTVAGPPAGETPSFIRASCLGNADITGPAEIHLDMAAGTKTVTGRNLLVGDVLSRGSTISSGAFFNGVNLDSSSLNITAAGGGASGTASPYTLDAASQRNVFVWHDLTSWPNTGTDTGGTSRFLPEGAAPPAAGFAPADATYLVTTADATLTAEVAVGATPGGELGGTWAAPTVDPTHSGSAHADFIAKAFFAAKGDLIGASANDTPVIIPVGSDGQVLTADSADSEGIAWKAPSGGASDRSDRTGGTLTLNSTTWADVDNTLDLVIAAVEGDWVEVGVSGAWSNNAVVGCLDAVSVVGGAPVNTWSTGAAESATGLGVQQWVGFSAVFGNAAGSITKQLVSGDLSGGNVTIRLRYRTATAANKGLVATADQPLTFWASNRRQP